MRNTIRIGNLRQLDEDNGEGSSEIMDTGTKKESNSQPDNPQDTSKDAQPTTTSHKVCEDDDDDECHTSTTSSTSTSSERSTVTLTTTLASTSLLSLPALPLPPAATTTLESTTSTASTTSSTPSVVATTRTISTITSFSTKFTTPFSGTPLVVPSISSRSSSIARIEPSVAISNTALNAQPALSSQTASSSGISSVGAKGSQAGVVVAILIGTLIAVVGLVFFIRRSFRRRRDANVGSSPPSSPIIRPSLSQPRSSDGWVEDIEQYRPRNPSHSRPSTIQSPTIVTGEIFPVTAVATLSSPALSNNPITRNILQSDGSIKTIIRPSPPPNSKESDIGEKRLTSKVQQTDIYIEENLGGEAFPIEYPKKLDNPPLAFDMLKVDENGKAEKQKTLLLEPKPGGRWSDPFTVAWRGSLEADGDGTRWKNARSWVKEQHGRLENPDLKDA